MSKYGRFKIEKTPKGNGRVSQKICWQSANSIGRDVEAATGKQGWETVILQEREVVNVLEQAKFK